MNEPSIEHRHNVLDRCEDVCLCLYVVSMCRPQRTWLSTICIRVFVSMEVSD